MAPSPAPLAPLRIVVVGILLVAIDLNLEAFDVLVDPVGYALVAWGLGRLAPAHPAFGWGRTAALVGIVTSTAGIFLRRVDPGTSTVVEHPLVAVADTIVEAIVVIAVCTALLALSRDPRVVGPARTLRVALPAVSVVGTLVALSLLPLEGSSIDTTSGGAAALAGAVAVLGIVLVVASIALAIWFIIVLLRAAREPAPAGPPQDLLSPPATAAS